MRILILSSEFPPGPGGIGTHAFQLAKYFSSQEHSVLVLSPQAYVTETERDAFNNVQKFRVISLSETGSPITKAQSRAKALRNALEDFHPDIIMISGGRSIWLSAVVLFGKKIPWVVIGHGTEFGAGSALDAILTRFTCDRADAIIAVSEYTRSKIVSLGISKPQITVIHNGADAHFFHPLPSSTIDAFRETHNTTEKYVLLTVGNVTPRKGQEWVVRALPAIISRYPDVVYWIVGLPSVQQELERLAADLGVEKNIHFWGRVDQPTLLNLYNACDLFLMTSQQLKNGDFEGYGISVIEAALCGKTSIVTNNSGLAEAVQDQETGILVPQAEFDPIAEAVISLIESPKKLQKLSETAYMHATSYQTWDRVGDSYIQYFNQILGLG